MDTKELTGKLRGISNAHSASNYRRTICKMAAQKMERLAAFEETGLVPEEIKELRTDDVVEVAKMLRQLIESGEADHLRELVQAERDGRLVVLPCKVGDTVYLIDRDGVVEAEVTCIRPFVFHNKIEFRGNAAWRFEDPFHRDGRILEQDVFVVFGKDAFPTRKEAEAALGGERS